jgi:cytochrome c oxidase subunit 3
MADHGSHAQVDDKAHAPGHTHPYHLVNPSPWPALGAASLFVLALGMSRFMHNLAGGGLMVLVGFIFVLFTMFVWWRDVIHEGRVEKVHTRAVRHGLRMGMGLFILSEVLFFSAFFWAFFNAAGFPRLPLTETWAIAPGVWPPKGIHAFDAWDIPLMNTVILLLSGTTVTWAHHSLLNGDRKGLVTGLFYTVLLGICFTCFQAYEYTHAAFGFKDGVYASTFFMATGFHGLHVIIGTIFLAVCFFRARKGHFTPEGHLGLEFAAWYWHFVDVVWLFLFVWVYWWGGA